MRYRSGSCFWSHIYQCNLHNIKKLILFTGFWVWSLVCFGPLWPYLARFGVPTPRHILPMHLHRSWVCPVQQESPPPHPKNSWEMWRLLHPKVTFCHPHVNCYYGSPSVTWRGSAIYTHRDPCTYTQCHAEVGEMADYPLCECECVCSEAMQGHSMQLRLQLCLNWEKSSVATVIRYTHLL